MRIISEDAPDKIVADSGSIPDTPELLPITIAGAVIPSFRAHECQVTVHSGVPIGGEGTDPDAIILFALSVSDTGVFLPMDEKIADTLIDGITRAKSYLRKVRGGD